MRRKVKQDIKDIMKTMQRAHNHAMGLLQNKRIVEAGDILAQCQDCALQIGESIENEGEKGKLAVSYLEDYCEELYKMSRTVDGKSVKKLKKELDRSLHIVESELDEEIPTDKMKIVFMPYKASMWDCMESVWEAAETDRECEAYVVPIPYYEKDQKGDMAKMCYEGKFFPKYVPIVPYENFSLETERPDIIYIHNPYDGANYVSSVHPDYYSSRLKKYTDFLVYIPYFFLGRGPMPEAHCSLPAYIYSDKIIVQDEEKAKCLSVFLPDNKIAVIGSPKVDRILKLERQKKQIVENDIPKEWKEKIEGKKVILFNVSVSGILQNSKYAMSKIRYILSCFEEREDILLLWRPHPLIEATLRSMRPELYDEYMEIKNNFIYKKKGIFDETGDAGVAAILADAYLGEDSSSLVHYFGVLGKPVLFIDWRISQYKDENKDFLLFEQFEQKNEHLFFVPFNKEFGSNLYRLDIKSGEIKKVIELYGIPGNIERCYCNIKMMGTKWVLVPYNTGDIYVYDTDKKQGTKIVLPRTWDCAELFGNIVEYHGKLYLIPIRYPAIVRIDTDNMEICEFGECIAPLIAKDGLDRFFAWTIKEGYIYMASSRTSKVVVFNMDNEKCEIKEIGNYLYGYNDMIYDGTYFWLTVRDGANRKNGHVIRWNESSGETKEYTYPITGEERLRDEKWNWSQSIDRKEELAIFDWFLQDIIMLDKKTGKCRTNQAAGKMIRKLKKGLAEKKLGSIVRVLDSDTVLLVDKIKCNIYIWNMTTNQWKIIPCRVSKDELAESENKQFEWYELIRAVPYHLLEDTVSVPRYIDYIVRGDMGMFETTYSCYKKENVEKTIGYHVHEYIKRCIG